jgi:membrane-associated phospholipid phosphatase
MRPRLLLAGLACFLLAAPCVVAGPGGVNPGSLPPAALERVLYWTDGYQRWNEIARDLIWLNDLSAPRAARVYAALSAAQWQAWRDATTLPAFSGHDLRDAALVPPGRGPPSARQRAACLPVAAASRAVLRQLFPADAARLDGLLQEYAASRVAAGWIQPGRIAAGFAGGAQSAGPVLEHLRVDGGADSPLRGPAAAGDWRTRDGEAGFDPEWGRVTPWLPGAPLTLPPPPMPGSPAWNAALDELRDISARLTGAQLGIAIRWAGGADRYTPPDIWNVIALELVRREETDESEALAALAAMNLAMADTGIAGWRIKYETGVPRPWQIDPALATPVRVPAFPSYPSGHSAFSWAAARALGALHPRARAELERQAEEASISRLYAGIHWRFDLDGGRALGEAAARRALGVISPGLLR